jgi:glucose/arabinose dehydrogenase
VFLPNNAKPPIKDCMKRLRKLFFFSLLSLFFAPAKGWGASAQLTARFSTNGKAISISIAAPRRLRCSGSLLLTSSARRPSARTLAQAQALAQFSSKHLTIRGLDKVRASHRNTTYIYITTSLNCSDRRKYKNTKRLAVLFTSSKRSSIRSVSELIKLARAKLIELISLTPTPTPTAGGTPLPFPPSGINVVQAFPALPAFSSLVDLRDAGDNSNRLFAVEQGGKIHAFDNNPNVSSSKLFLDISSKLAISDERGLLGLVFHPQYKTNGYFYVDYIRSSDGASVISRFKVSANPDQADVNSEIILLTVAQPFDNHKGGSLQFGPDGYLYITLGDGGSGGDPQGNGQNLKTLLGKILRIDVNSTSGGNNYAIPSSNPFAGNTSGIKKEIFAYGFRNPWRTSFDFPSGRFWVGDVGQGDREEVDIVNYGWNKMEGTICYPPGSSCSTSGLELPVIDYDHSLGIAVTGGYVYRGTAVNSLSGVYLYGDYGSGRIWGIRRLSPFEHAQLLDSDLSISSFAIDKNGEVYILDYGSGKIYRFQG